MALNVARPTTGSPRWPNITVPTDTFQEVYVRTFLFKWNGSLWVAVANSPWYVGASNNQGRGLPGNFPYPYWFATNTSPSRVAPELGMSFTQLTPGYYATGEEYYVAGKYFWQQTAILGSTTEKWCQI